MAPTPSAPLEAPLVIVQLPWFENPSYTFFYEENEDKVRVHMPCSPEARRSILLLCQHFLASADIFGIWQPVDQQADRLLRLMPQGTLSSCWLRALVSFRYIKQVVEQFASTTLFNRSPDEEDGIDLAPHEQWALREAAMCWRDVLYPAFAKDNAYPFGEDVLSAFDPTIELIDSWTWIDPLKGYLRIRPLAETDESPEEPPTS